ncbi:MAG: formate dehydrogenase accessory sulfurtransferase FdhD [Bacillota bacterium]|nr:MAG: formate dehydrogenase accessory sulfurtransferase FdhD [Bacillota bacterium]
MELASTIKITRYREGKWSHDEDLVIKEVPVTIYANGHELVTTLASPSHLEDLALGYLKAEGLLDNLDQLEAVKVDPGGNWVKVNLKGEIHQKLKDRSQRILTSGCGRGSVFYRSLYEFETGEANSSNIVFSEKVVGDLVSQFHKNSHLFRQTGGVHGAALADEKGIIFFREDIGRHNAVDKVIGRCILDGVDCRDKILIISGRISSEIVLKAARIGVPLLISPSAPTDLAVKAARLLRLTLVGFARGKRFNVYAGEMRLPIKMSQD